MFRTVCIGFKTESESLFKKHNKLWIKGERSTSFSCFDNDHFIGDRDCISCKVVPTLDQVNNLASMLPNLEVLKIDFIATRKENGFEFSYPLRAMFSSVVCLMAPQTDLKNGHLRRNREANDCKLRHLQADTIDVLEVRDSFPVLESIDVTDITDLYGMPRPSKRIVCRRCWSLQYVTIEWLTMSKTLEVCQANIDFAEYKRKGYATFPQLRELGSVDCPVVLDEQLTISFTDFIQDHKSSIRSLTISEVSSCSDRFKSLVECFSNLHSLTLFIRLSEITPMKILKETFSQYHFNFKHFSLHVLLKQYYRDLDLLNFLPNNLSYLSIRCDSFSLNSTCLLRKSNPSLVQRVFDLLTEGNPKEFAVEGLNLQTITHFEKAFSANPLLDVNAIESLGSIILVVRKKYQKSEPNPVRKVIEV